MQQTIDAIIEHHRMHRDYLRSRIGLENRLFAICMRNAQRLESGLPDKADARALYDAIYKRRAPDYHDTAIQARVEKWCAGIAIARDGLGHQVKVEVKLLEQLAADLPVAAWVATVKGFGMHGLAQIVGEAGADLSCFPTVRRLWKRLGVGVIDGERQNNFAGDAEKNKAHGYNRERRSVLSVIGQSLIRARGEYYAVYAERKAWKRRAIEDADRVVCPSSEWKKLPAELRGSAWTLMHLDKDARRFTEKRLVRDLWLRWNGIETPLAGASA